MATQRVSLAKIGGEAANTVAKQFQLWAQTRQGDEFPTATQLALDTFADLLRDHSPEPPIVYFSEWIDMWSMGDLIPTLGNERAVTIAGQRYEASCHTPPISLQLTATAGELTQESEWLNRRLEEASEAWHKLVPIWVIVVLREPLGGLVQDTELASSLDRIPSWLSSLSGIDELSTAPESEKRHP